jgi:hypothetical protein
MSPVQGQASSTRELHVSGSNSLHGMRQVKELEALGWRIVQSKHVKAYCPCGQHMLTIARTSGDNRAVKNLEAQVRRILRECPPSTP